MPHQPHGNLIIDGSRSEAFLSQDHSAEMSSGFLIRKSETPEMAERYSRTWSLFRTPTAHSISCWTWQAHKQNYHCPQIRNSGLYCWTIRLQTRKVDKPEIILHFARNAPLGSEVQRHEDLMEHDENWNIHTNCVLHSLSSEIARKSSDSCLARRWSDATGTDHADANAFKISKTKAEDNSREKFLTSKLFMKNQHQIADDRHIMVRSAPQRRSLR